MIYKLVFNFIIPVYRASRQMKNAMNKAQEQMKQQQSTQSQADTSPRKSMQNDQEYIDYEEVR
jgi:Sec-independent protein translocase protein TatA